jgi:hypothetical protein
MIQICVVPESVLSIKQIDLVYFILNIAVDEGA